MYRFIAQILFLILSFVIRDCICEFLWRSAGVEPWNQTSLCTSCGTKPTAFVENNCHYKNYHIYSRCCLDSSNRTVGVDLGNCSITNIKVLSNAKDVSWINLASNPTLNCSNPSFSNVFEGFKKLNKIILPAPSCDCPSGNLLWNETRTFNKSRICLMQQSTCSFYNVSCPANSICSNNGPGFYQCLCDDNWTGYRCLVKKGIPLTIILCCIAGGTILIIIPIALLIKRREKMQAGYNYVEGTTRG